MVFVSAVLHHHFEDERSPKNSDQFDDLFRRHQLKMTWCVCSFSNISNRLPLNWGPSGLWLGATYMKFVVPIF